MLESLILIIIAASILTILFFAFMTKNKLASNVSYVILAAIAVSMALRGLVGLIIDVDFLSFLVSILRFLNDLVIFFEIGLIVYFLFFTGHKNKVMLVKVAIIVYAVLSLLIEFNIL